MSPALHYRFFAHNQVRILSGAASGLRPARGSVGGLRGAEERGP